MTLEADYAVRIVEFLAMHPEKIDAKTAIGKTNNAALHAEDPAHAGGGRHALSLRQRKARCLRSRRRRSRCAA